MSVVDVVSAFPRQRTWLLPALQAAQRVEGWLPADALEAIAAHLRVPRSEVWGVASQYPELRLVRPGARVVRVCTGLGCQVRGARALLAHAEQTLGVRAGAITSDGAITLEESDCAFACGVAPVVEADHRLHGRVTPAALDRLLTAAATGQAPALPPPVVVPPPPLSGGAPLARMAALRRHAGQPRPDVRLAVGVGTCGLAVGAGETLQALCRERERRGLDWTIVAAGCPGACWAAPVVLVRRDGREPLAVANVGAADVPRLLDALLAGTGEADGFATTDRRPPRVLLERCGDTDPHDIADAIRGGAYETLARVLEEGRPEAVIEELRAAGLAGRGGAYFQTAVKWAACRAAVASPKFVVVNGEEGEPGIFKDRHLMEGDPHRLLEATLLAAYAVGASRAIVYVNGEADLAAARLAVAHEQARQWGLVGEAVLGSTLSLDLEIRRGAGGFVLGEETALLESIEGRRAMPRTRPPFPVDAGLWGQPTVINNVETLFAVVPILARGGAWWASLGGGRGTKLFGLSGHVRRPGLVEVEVGATLQVLLQEHGAGWDAPIAAAVVGGPSGSVVHPRQFDASLIPRGPVNPGTGGVVALERGTSVADAVRTLLAFNARESCGKCTPCREGTQRLLSMLDAPLDAARATALAEAVQLASLCGLGQAAPLSLLSALAEFPAEMAVKQP